MKKILSAFAALLALTGSNSSEPKAESTATTDGKAIHLWLTLEDKIVALARVCPAGTHITEISIGRVITTERGKGYGKQIMLHAIDAAIEHFGATLIDIEAQEYAKGFYEGVGFKQSSDIFMLDGIPHIKMTWRK